MPNFSVFNEKTPSNIPSGDNFFRSLEKKVLLPNVSTLLKLNLKSSFSPESVLLISNLPDEHEDYKEDVRVLAGVIDSDYRGEIGILLINKSNREICIEQGKIIAQFHLLKISNEDFVLETESVRGEKGFGSTGK